MLRAKSTRHALECLTADGQRKYSEAIEYGGRWDKEAGANDSDTLAIRYLTALAYQAQSSALPARDPNRKKLAGVARDYVVPVASQPGEYQKPAKMMLVALAGNKDAKQGAAAKPSFAEALEQAKAALASMQDADAGLKAAAGADKARIESLKRQKQSSAALARQALELALATSDDKTNRDDLNSARYYLCFLDWDEGRLHEAAVLGEFLARRYPDSLPGRQGARIALAAYVRMVADAKAGASEFETRHIERLGQEIFQRFAGQEEADEAALQLVSFAASQNQPEKLVEYLKKVSVNSPRRGQAELRAGQALWSAYLRRSQLADGGRPPQAELDAIKKQAQEVLAEGIGRMEKAGQVDATMTAAVFAMAQICVDTGQPDKAISWLEHAKVGPLTLVKANHPAAARQEFAVEAYKLALRSYIAVNPQQLKKAEEAMDALEKLVKGAGDAKAAENLTAIYVGLGRQLEQHLQELRKSGQTKELESVSKAFEIFLDRVTKRETGNSYASLNWVGATYFSLGGGLDEGPQKISPKAKAYFQKAADAYQRMLAVAEKDPKFKDNPDSLAGVRLRLADCYRRAGRFDEATKIVVDVLKQKPTLLAAQVQAAATYQAQGAVDPQGYARAILGGAPARDGKNVVWGWAKVSKMTMSDPKFQDTFHEARLNLAEARYRYGMTHQDPAKRSKLLEAARQDLWITFKHQPELGGPETAARYDRLLRRIQQALGGKETGLAEFRERDAASTTTATNK
jgi:tetratricopeptide (TPR) repeat protein